MCQLNYKRKTHSKCNKKMQKLEVSCLVGRNDNQEISGAVVSRLDYGVGDPESIPAGAESPTGI